MNSTNMREKKNQTAFRENQLIFFFKHRKCQKFSVFFFYTQACRSNDGTKESSSSRQVTGVNCAQSY